MTVASNNRLEAWRNSRSGAWAGRGFHYQHLVITYLIIRQWCGDDPAGLITPEGLEDCVIELPDHETWVQIKSRYDGEFAEREFDAIYEKLQSKSDQLDDLSSSKFRIAFEASEGFDARNIQEIYSASDKAAVAFSSPETLIIDRLVLALDIAPATAESIFQDIYTLVVSTSEENAHLDFSDRKRISVNEIELRISERLRAHDPSAIDAAIKTGALQAVDFVTPLNEPNFYIGVKVRPGHIAANLVAERPADTQSAMSSLLKRRSLLFAGPSGAGKSAQLWLTAKRLDDRFRWFEISSSAGAEDVQDIVNFIIARHPSEKSPIALAVDDVGTNCSDLWDILIRELRGMANVYLLGSIRQEDMGTVYERSETEIVQVALSEQLAEFVWNKLRQTGGTAWQHWREPFEQSDGLMLEFTHILTQGKRLTDVIAEQVRRREKENRDDELSIIRVTSAICARGGEVRVGQLAEILGLSSKSSATALKRLVDEHLIREERPGILGGLHLLRSEALLRTSHDELVYLSDASVWRGLPAAAPRTLPQIIQSIFADVDVDEPMALQKVADFLSTTNDTQSWISTLTGLGLATLSNAADILIASLRRYEVERTHWALASMFSDPDIDMPEMDGFDTWARIRAAVEDFKNETVVDLRKQCLSLFSETPPIPLGNDPFSANKLLACLAPLVGGASLALNIENDYQASNEHSIDDIASLLSTAKYVNAELCDDLLAAYGGEQSLLSRYISQEPWLSESSIGDEQHGRTVRADFYCIAVNDDGNQSINDRLVRICETLISFSPHSDAAACEAIAPDGSSIEFGGMTLQNKNMPRENLPAKTRVAWNVAFKQIFLAKAGQDSLTYYATEMSTLTRSTEKLFRQFSERWIKGKQISNANDLASEINDICSKVNALAYAAPSKLPSSMEESVDQSPADDTLGALLTGVLINLTKQLSNMPSKTGGKAAASNAGDLSMRAAKYQESDIWRVIDDPPLDSLGNLSARLLAVSGILHEMDQDTSPNSIEGIVKAAKGGRLGRAINSASVYSYRQADRRFRELLNNLQKNAAEAGAAVECHARPINDRKTIYWPPKEIAVVVSISDFEKDAERMSASLEVCGDIIGEAYKYCIVPLVNGLIVPSLAVQNTSFGTLPAFDFAEHWREALDDPILVSEGADAFDAALRALSELSALVNCRALDSLLPAEEAFFELALGSFRIARGRISDFEQKGIDEFSYALHVIDECHSRVLDEADAQIDGSVTAQPLWKEAFDALGGHQSDWSIQLAGLLVLLRQSEANSSSS